MLRPGSVRAYRRRVALFQAHDYAGEMPHRHIRPAGEPVTA